jgi:hypothetical protein
MPPGPTLCPETSWYQEAIQSRRGWRGWRGWRSWRGWRTRPRAVGARFLACAINYNFFSTRGWRGWRARLARASSRVP